MEKSATKAILDIPFLSNRLNHELYSEPSFPAPQLYLLSHTLSVAITRNLDIYPWYITCFLQRTSKEQLVLPYGSLWTSHVMWIATLSFDEHLEMVISEGFTVHFT